MNENKFDGKGMIYAQFRPVYPTAFIDYLYADVGVHKDSVIADVGSGTGILAKHFLEKGNRVYAVEPNVDMRTMAENDLQSFDGFISIDGTAENTTLEAQKVDFITVGQAFHWFDRARFQRECRRILRSGGKVILVWNCRVEESEIVMENAAINQLYCPSFKGFSDNQMRAESRDDFTHFFAGDYDMKVFENNIRWDEQHFIGRNLSSSYALQKEDKNHAAYVEALRKLFSKYSERGCLLFPNLTRSYVGMV